MNAEQVIERFGGIRPMAQKLGIAVSTIQGWKTRNRIPGNRWEDVRMAAEAAGISIDGDEPAALEDTPIDVAAENAVSVEVENETGSETTGTPPGDDTDEEAVTTASETPAAPVETGTRPSRGFGGLALFLAIVALAGIATRGYWGPAVDPLVEKHLTGYFGPPVDKEASVVEEYLQTDLERTQTVIAANLKRLDDIEKRIGALATSETGSVSLDTGPLEDRITALEDRLVAGTSNGGAVVDLTPIESALAALRSRVASLDGKTGASIDTFELKIGTFRDELTAAATDIEAAAARVAALSERIRLLETSPGNPAIGQSALVLAVGQLEILADSGAEFSDALPGLRELAGEDAETAALVDGLEAAASTGVPTVAVLADRFYGIVALVDGSETGRVEGGWVEESLASLQSLVSVRRVDDTPGAPAATRAENALGRGDLKTAVAAIEPFRGAGPEIANWLSEAETRLFLDDAIAELRNRALDRLRAIATAN